ncbi:TolC family protein [Xanthovirga aplysinae]|uniref:TolC family protein n=1 Tax=Xanthovirga aplysinae TaxID=2529853 RepID=UPI001656ACA9|nr:TolC family protein [Xanthovirga aplysinae]
MKRIKIIKQIPRKTGPILGLLLLLLLGMGSFASAQSLDDYLREAAENNPNLEALFNDYQAALELVPQVGALPDPSLSIGYYIQPIQTRNGPTQGGITIGQQFPWFGTLKARKDVASQSAAAKFWEFNSAKNDLFFNIRQNWYQLFELEERIRITKENIDLLNYLETLATQKYETGKASMADVITVQLKIREAENQLALLQLNKKPLVHSFNNFLNRDPEENIQIPESIPLEELPNENNLEIVFQQNPQMKTLNAMKKAAKEQQRVAKLQGRPNISLSVQYVSIGRISGDDQMVPVTNGKNVIMPMVGVSIPLYRKKYNALKKEANFNLKSIEAKEIALKNDLSLAYTQIMEGLKASQLSIALYKEQIAQGKQALTLTIKDFSTGKKSYEEVLRIQGELLVYELSSVEAKVSFNTTVAQLNQLAATELEI